MHSQQILTDKKIAILNAVLICNNENLITSQNK